MMRQRLFTHFAFRAYATRFADFHYASHTTDADDIFAEPLRHENITPIFIRDFFFFFFRLASPPIFITLR